MPFVRNSLSGAGDVMLRRWLNSSASTSFRQVYPERSRREAPGSAFASRKESKGSKREKWLSERNPCRRGPRDDPCQQGPRPCAWPCSWRAGLLMLVNPGADLLLGAVGAVHGYTVSDLLFPRATALAGFIAAVIVFISSILYLWKGQRKWDAWPIPPPRSVCCSSP